MRIVQEFISNLLKTRSDEYTSSFRLGLSFLVARLCKYQERCYNSIRSVNLRNNIEAQGYSCS